MAALDSTVRRLHDVLLLDGHSAVAQAMASVLALPSPGAMVNVMDAFSGKNGDVFVSDLHKLCSRRDVPFPQVLLNFGARPTYSKMDVLKESGFMALFLEAQLHGYCGLPSYLSDSALRIVVDQRPQSKVCLVKLDPRPTVSQPLPQPLPKALPRGLPRPLPRFAAYNDDFSPIFHLSINSASATPARTPARTPCDSEDEAAE